jgi:hypothetical protein
MGNEDNDKAKIFRRPGQNRATRKVAALPDLIKRSQRPDGQKVQKVEGEPQDSDDEKDAAAKDDDASKKADEKADEPGDGKKKARGTDKDSEALIEEELDVDDGGLFDGLFDDDDLFGDSD